MSTYLWNDSKKSVNFVYRHTRISFEDVKQFHNLLSRDITHAFVTWCWSSLENGSQWIPHDWEISMEAFFETTVSSFLTLNPEQTKNKYTQLFNIFTLGIIIYSCNGPSYLDFWKNVFFQ